MPGTRRSCRTALPSRAHGLLPGPAAALLGGLFVALSMPAAVSAQVVLLPEASEPPVFPVSRLELVYAAPHPRQPPLEPLVPIRVELQETERGWAAPLAGQRSQTLSIGGPGSAPVRLEPSGLAAVLRAIVKAVHEAGLYGVDVRPSSRDIDLERERDRRPAGRDALEIVVTVGRIEQVRTIAIGDRIEGTWKVDHELHERIRTGSPLRPIASGDDDTTDLVDRRALEDYLHRLNRHPGRRVEAALAPAEEPGGVVLDYRVLESRPWFVYSQASNTGTRRTSRWQTRVGVVHRQLTNRDDILSIEYLNGSTDVNGVRARYEAPFWGSERPDWMKSSETDVGWLDRFPPRDKIPWWGLDGVRWDSEFTYGRFEAGRGSEVDIVADRVLTERIQGGAGLTYEAFQHRDFFLDVRAGFLARYFRVDNRTADVEGEATFLRPRVSVKAERINAISNLRLNFGVEGQVLSIERDEIERMGRPFVDDQVAVLDFDVGFSTYLEPLLFPKAFRDPKSRLSSTLAHEIGIGGRGQYAFDFRLIPQDSQIVGGLYSVRGYRQSEAVGDSVFIGTFEYRFHLPRTLPISREPLEIPGLGDFRATPQQVYGRPDWDFILRAFVDVGRSVRNVNGVVSSSVNPNFESDDTLLGMGVGAELTIRSNFRARVDWATPFKTTADERAQGINVDPGDKSEFHFLFSLLF